MKRFTLLVLFCLIGTFALGEGQKEGPRDQKQDLETASKLPLSYSLAQLQRFWEIHFTLSNAEKEIFNALIQISKKSGMNEKEYNDAIGIIVQSGESAKIDLLLAMMHSKEILSAQEKYKNAEARSTAMKELARRDNRFIINSEVMSQINSISANRRKRRISNTEMGLKIAQIMGSKVDSQFIDYVKSQLIYLLPENDPAHGWDWSMSGWYTRLGLSFPWSASGSRTGVDVTADPCSPDDGWELYIRRILNIDTETVQTDIIPGLRQTDIYFALYNVYTGVLRVFIYYKTGDTLSDYLIHRTAINLGSEGNTLHKHGLFNHIGPLCRTGNDIPSMQNNEIYGVTEVVDNGWIILDFPLAYDVLTSYSEGPFYLSTKTCLSNEQNLSLTGNFSMEVPIATPKTGLYGLFESFLNIFRTGNTNAATIRTTAANLIQYGADIDAAGGSGLLLTTLGTLLRSNGFFLTAALATTQILQSVMNLGDRSGGVKYAYYKGTLGLKGQIIDEAFRKRIAIAIADTPNLISYDMPYYFKKYPSRILGTFNLLETPTLKTSCTHGANHMTQTGNYTLYRLDCRIIYNGDLPRRVVINPDCPIQLQMVSIQPIIKKVWNYADDHGGLLLGSQVIGERDPADNKEYSIFFNSFFLWGGLNWVFEQTFFSRGTAYRGGSDTYKNDVANETFLKMYLQFVGKGEQSQRRFEYYNTYQCGQIYEQIHDDRIDRGEY